MGQAKEVTLNFATIRPGIYWYDDNGDGEVEAEEEFKGKIGDLPTDTVSKFVKEHPKLFFTNTPYKIAIHKSLQDYFSDPVKTQFEKTLAANISSLESSQDKPKAYVELLDDLKLIQAELKRTRFQPVSEEEISPNLATYDEFTSTVQYLDGISDAPIVHEMDHALTSHVRTDHFSKAHPTKLSFVFSLDYPKGRTIKLRYNRSDSPVQKILLTGKLCNTEASKRAALAHEVRAYQTMCRYYLFFKLEIRDSKELDRISKMNPKELSQFLDGKKAKLTDLCGADSKPEWVKNLLLHYFAKGGASGRESLDVFVKNEYEKNKAPAFRNGCVEDF